MEASISADYDYETGRVVRFRVTNDGKKLLYARVKNNLDGEGFQWRIFAITPVDCWYEELDHELQKFIRSHFAPTSEIHDVASFIEELAATVKGVPYCENNPTIQQRVIKLRQQLNQFQEPEDIPDRASLNRTEREYKINVFDDGLGRYRFAPNKWHLVSVWREKLSLKNVITGDVIDSISEWKCVCV